MKFSTTIIALIFALSWTRSSAQQYGSTPEDSVECIKNVSLYSEFYKQRNYVDAFEPWLITYRLCPGSHKNRFIHGNVIVATRINREKDPAKRQELIELMLGMWDKRAELFGQEAYCMGRKALAMRDYQPGKVQEVYELLKKTVEMGAEETNIPFFFFESAMATEKAGKITKEEVLEAYDIASTALEAAYKQNPKDTQLFQTLTNLDIAFEPYASCEEIVPLYEKKYEENKGNVAFLEKICKVLDRKDCNESELFFKATEALYALKPDPKTAYLMAKMCDGKKMFNDVEGYLKDNVSKLESERDQVRAYLLLAKAQLNLSKYTEARQSALKALELNPSEGKAYILIGHMYAQSAKICGDEPAVSQRAAYWAAVDKFRKAKEIDENCAEEADNLIATYVKHFPSGDDLFFVGVNENSTYRVGCWIQENTIVRSR